MNSQFSARFEKYFVFVESCQFIALYASAILSVYIKDTVFIMSIFSLTCNWQKYLNIGGGANCNKTRGAGCNRRKNEISAFYASHCLCFI